MATAAHDRRTPTVIVARTAKRDREAEFERWLRDLVSRAAHAPGYVDAEIQPPGALHPDEWLVVYQFQDTSSLDAWLASDERAALMAGGNELVDGPAREQVVALAPQAGPVTAVSSVRVRPGELATYRALHEQMEAELARAPGFLASELLEPVDGVQEELVVVFTFDDQDHLEQWLASAARHRILRLMDDVVEGDRTVNVVGGFAGWFMPSSRAGGGFTEPRRWKQAAVVLLAIAPTSLVLTALRQWLLPDLALVPAVALNSTAGVALLSWVLMPLLTRWLAPWLRR
jgi:antibiotic biosynthesis monooxygenase (ABM) superfamily enzyme